MHHLKGSLLAGVLALVCALPAAAQTSGSISVKSAATGTPTVGLACQFDTLNLCHYRHVIEGLDNSGNPVAVYVDPSTRWLGVNVETSALPTGAATGAKQDTGNASLSSVDTKLSKGQGTKAQSISISPPSDPDPLTVTGTITAADAATTTVSGQGGVTLINGTPTTNAYVDIPLNGVSSVAITVTGTFSATMPIEASADGAIFAPAGGKIRGSSTNPAPVSAITGPGIFRVDTAGMTDLRVRASAFVSGTANLKFKPSVAPGVVENVAATRITDPAGNLSSGGAYATTDGSTTQTTGGTAQALFSGATPVHGWKVFIPSASPGSATCWVSDTTTTPSATTAGSYPAAYSGGFISETGQLPPGPVYVNCPTTGQPISAQKW